MNDEYDDADYGFEDDAPRRGNKNMKKFKHRNADGDKDYKRERERQRAEKSKRQMAD